MALTSMTLKKSTRDADLFVDVVEFVGDAAYDAGGEPFEAPFEALVGSDRDILFVSGYGGNNTVEFVPSTPIDGAGKLKVRAAGGAEFSGDLSAVTFRVCVWSK